MVRSNYNNLLKVDPIDAQGTRVTKVTKKDYGYRVQMFNTFITEYFIKLIINDNKSAKAHFLVRRNYAADCRYTLYYDISGEQITPQQYKSLNKK